MKASINNYGYTEQQYKRFRSSAWKMLISFGLTYLFFYNGRQNINLVLSTMAESLGSTTAAMGIVSSSLFWCYAFGQLVNGRLGAYFGYKPFMMLGVAGSALLNILISFQHSIPVIALLWGLNGYCQSMVWSNGVGVMNRWWPKKERGFASGVASAFAGAAQLVTYVTVLMCMELSPHWGWRAAFRFPMLPMLLMLVFFAFLFKTGPEKIGLPPFCEEDEESAARDTALETEIKQKGFFYPYKLLFSEPKLIAFCLISSISGIGHYGLLTWIPTYFTEAMGLSIKDGIFSAILLPTGQALAMFTLPFITDKTFKGRREPALVLAAVIAFCGMMIFPFVQSRNLASLLLLIVGAFGTVTGVIWAIAGDLGGRALSSTVAGVLDWAVYMGAAVQATLFGFAKDAFGWSAIFFTIAVLYVLLLVLTLLARKMKIKRL